MVIRPVAKCPRADAERVHRSAAMAKRRFLEKQPLTEAEGLTALIMMGVGLTLGGISVTILMALNASALGLGALALRPAEFRTQASQGQRSPKPPKDPSRGC